MKRITFHDEGWVLGRQVAQGGRVQGGGRGRRGRDVVGGGPGAAGEQRDAQERERQNEIETPKTTTARSGE